MYYGDESIKSIHISDFIGKPEKRLFKENRARYSIQKVSPGEATEKVLQFHAKHSISGEKTAAKLQLIKNKALTEKLEIILEMLVKHLDPLNYDQIMNDTESKITQNYLEILPIFLKKVEAINPDDYGRLSVIRSLAARYSKNYIVQGINNVIV